MIGSRGLLKTACRPDFLSDPHLGHGRPDRQWKAARRHVGMCVRRWDIRYSRDRCVPSGAEPAPLQLGRHHALRRFRVVKTL